MSVIDEIAAERRRQIDVEGFCDRHDDCARVGELALSASAYAMVAGSAAPFPCLSPQDYARVPVPKPLWPWGPLRWKPKDPRRDLIRAAALIVAEIERIDRAAARKRQPDSSAA